MLIPYATLYMPHMCMDVVLHSHQVQQPMYWYLHHQSKTLCTLAKSMDVTNVFKVMMQSYKSLHQFQV